MGSEVKQMILKLLSLPMQQKIIRSKNSFSSSNLDHCHKKVKEEVKGMMGKKASESLPL